MSEEKNTLKNKKIADGELAPRDYNLSNARTIDELLGAKEDLFSPWKVKTEAELEERFEGMNLADLQNLATRVGIIPVSDRRVLKQRLTKQFQSELQSKSRPPKSPKPNGLNKKMKKKDRDRVLSILREGR